MRDDALETSAACVARINDTVARAEVAGVAEALREQSGQAPRPWEAQRHEQVCAFPTDVEEMVAAARARGGCVRSARPPTWCTGCRTGPREPGAARPPPLTGRCRLSSLDVFGGTPAAADSPPGADGARGGEVQLASVGHVALTVADLQRSRNWYERVLDWSAVFEGEGEGVRFTVGVLPGGLMIGLREYDGEGVSFDPTRVGLDHLAFAVPFADLRAWEQRFADLDVTFDPVQDTPFGFVLNFKDPDGIALELTASKT